MENYELSAAAIADLKRLYSFGIMRFGEQLADQYYDGLIKRFQQIGDMPLLYPAIDEIRQGYRRSVYGSHSIYYKMAENCVQIIRILSREDVKNAL